MKDSDLMRVIGTQMGWSQKIIDQYSEILDLVDEGKLDRQKVISRLEKILEAKDTTEVEKQLRKLKRGK